MQPTRRKILAGAAALGLSRRALAAETITVTAYGGEYRDLFTKAVIEPFEAKFSCKVIYDESSGTDPYPRVRATRGSPGFDVVGETTAPMIILGAKEKLYEPISEKEVPNLKYAFQKSASVIPPNGIVQTYQYLALIWDKNKIDKPASWLDYWQAGEKYGDKIKGHVITHGPSNFPLLIYAMIMGARAKGGGETDLSASWTMLEALKPYVGTVAATSAQAVPYMENEQVWIMPFWSARAALYAARGLPFGYTVPKEGTIALANCAAVPVGAPNKKLAYEFLNFRLDPEIQKAFCEAYYCSPGRPDVPGFSPAFVDQQITTEAKMASMVFPDDGLIAQKQREWTLRWNEIMST
jgi:putative spermidine/putrescine transport system substrate-binding protein